MVKPVEIRDDVTHGIVVADSHDVVCVFGAHLLTSALDAAGVGSRWIVSSAVPPHRLRVAEVTDLPSHVRAIVPRVTVADPDLLASAELVLGFTDLRWPVVDHVRALHCPAPALTLPEFVVETEALGNTFVSFEELSDAAMLHALSRPGAHWLPSDANLQDDEFWTELADVCARFATVVQRVSR